MVAHGGDNESPDPERWPVVETFSCLGHLFQHDGGIRACACAAKLSCWGVFWANFGNRRARALRLPEKIRLLERAVTPGYRFKCTRWPPQRNIALEFDKVQNKMVAVLMRVPRLPGEPAHEYVRRRNHAASCQTRAVGKWSDTWYKRVVNWKDHLERPRNAHSWPAQLLHYRGEGFLQQTRVDNNSASALAGSTRTRAMRGIVHTRWHDGANLAASRCNVDLRSTR